MKQRNEADQPCEFWASSLFFLLPLGLALPALAFASPAPPVLRREVAAEAILPRNVAPDVFIIIINGSLLQMF